MSKKLLKVLMLERSVSLMVVILKFENYDFEDNDDDDDKEVIIGPDI